MSREYVVTVRFRTLEDNRDEAVAVSEAIAEYVRDVNHGFDISDEIKVTLTGTVEGQE